MPRIVSPRFQLQLAVLSQPAGVDGVRTIARNKMTVQQVQDATGKFHNGLLTGTVTASAGSITCADADFTTGVAELTLGSYKLFSNVEYATGTAAQTATALTAAINNLQDFSAEVDGGDNTKVNVSGPTGLEGQAVPFKVLYTGSKTNYTLSPATGILTRGQPYLGPPTF